MTSRPLQLIDFTSQDPLANGHQHGETLRRQIAEIADIRLELMCSTSRYTRTKDVLALAEMHLPILQEFDVDLFLELRGISEASNVSLERLVVLNHFTDMRDIIPGNEWGPSEVGGCSIIFNPTAFGPVLGQTWDIHGSATPYTIMMRINGQLLFSIAGCLGMTGINSEGCAIAINNLASIDAKVGILWPALVRKALGHKNAAHAKEEIMKAPLGSGRHFAIADDSNFFGVETSGTKKKVVWTRNDELYIHTNHCLDAEMKKTHIIKKESTTLWRYQQLDDVIRYKDLSSAEKIFVALKDVSLKRDLSMPHKTATCGTFVMDINNKFALGCQGPADQELLKWTETKALVK